MIWRFLRFLGLAVLVGIALMLIFSANQYFDQNYFSFRFNAYAIPSIVAVLFLVILFLRIVSLPTKIPYTFPFVLFLLALVWWGTTEVFQRLSETAVAGSFWNSLAGITSPLVPVAFMLFCFSYSRRPKTILNGLILVTSLIIGAVFQYIMLTTELVSLHAAEDLILKPWGFVSLPGPLASLYIIWFIGVFAISLSWLIEFVKQSTNTLEKQQTKIIIFGVVIPLIGGAFTDGLGPFTDRSLLPVAVSLTAITALTIGYAINKFKIFAFDSGVVGREVISSLPNPVLAISLDEKLIYMNQSARQLFGVDLQAIFSGSVWDHCKDPGFKNALQVYLLPMLRSGKTAATFEKPLPFELDGKLRHFEIVASRINSETGEISSYIIVLTDVEKLQEVTSKEKLELANLEKTKQALLNILEDDKELEESIKFERDKLNAIFRSIGDGVVVLNEELKINALNSAGEQLLGFEEKELLGKHWYDVVTTYVGDRKIGVSERKVFQVLKSGKASISKLEDDHYFETTKKHKFPVVTTTTPFKSQDLAGVIVVFQDATQQKDVRERIESLVKARTEELRLVEARLISSIKGLEIGFIMTDLNQQVLMINEAALKIIHSDDEPKELDAGEGIHLATIENIAKSLRGKIDLVKEIDTAIIESKKISISDVAVGHKDLQVYITPILMEQKSIGSVIILIDTTVAKQLDRAKDDFLSIASHELRTPLTAIMGNASMIEQFYGDKIKDADLKSMLTDMKTASSRLITLVNDFLSVSRLEQGRMVIKPEMLSLAKISAEVIEEIKPNLKPNLKMIISTKEDKQVFADPAKTKEVLVNLLGNAIKYSEKGEIALSWEGDKEITIRVTDTGVGIAPNDQLRLFHKFQQAGTSSLTRDTTSSSGLGLYISKLLVEVMGGKIGLEKSVPGKGSTFFFTLPSQGKVINKL